MLKRPVKLALSRSQMYGPVGHRGATWQKLRMGMDEDGRLTAPYVARQGTARPAVVRAPAR